MSKTSNQPTIWRGLSAMAAMGTAVAARRLLATMWPGDSKPPLNPTDRSVSWPEALTWALVSGAGAGVTRVLARRGAAETWERLSSSSTD